MEIIRYTSKTCEISITKEELKIISNVLRGENKIKITKQEIVDVFDDLINHKMSKEDCSNYANHLMRLNDNRQLEFDPRKDEDKIWKGISYLLGVDLKDMDGSYLHSTENFINFLDSIKNDE